VEVALRRVAERGCYREENYWKLNYRYGMLGASEKRNCIENARGVKDSNWHLRKSVSLTDSSCRYYALVSRVAK